MDTLNEVALIGREQVNVNFFSLTVFPVLQ